MPSAKSVPAALGRLREPLQRIARELGVSHAHGRLDQLGQRPHRHPVVEGVRRGLPGRTTPPPRSGPGRCTGLRPPNAQIATAPAASRRCLLAISAEASASRPCRARSRSSGVRHEAAPRSLPQRCRPPRQARRRPRSRRSTLVPCPSADRWIGSSASAPASRTNRSSSRRSPACARRPTRVAGGRGQPAPAKGVLRRDLQRLPLLVQGRNRGGVSVGGQHGEAIEQQVEWTRRSRRRREGPGGAGDLADEAPCREVAGCRRAPGDQVGLAREAEVERFELSRGPQQQWRSVVADQGEGMWPRSRRSRALELVERSGLCGGRQLERRVELPGLEARLRRGQRALLLVAPGRP